MNIHRLFTIGILGLFLLAGTAFAQNIQTDTTSTTIGSTQFGFPITPAELGTVMQATVAPTCTGPVNARVCDGGAAQGTNTAFVRINALPGSHPSNPFGTISTQPNFACGPTAASTDCFNIKDNGSGTGGSQTAPNFGGPNQLVGVINMDVDLGGAGTPGMPEGFMRFTLDPGTQDTTIDQLIDHDVVLGPGTMTFQQRDATIGYGNLIADAEMDATTAGTLALLPFTSQLSDTNQPASTGMVSRLRLAQGPADGFGALDLDITVDFPGGTNNAGDFPGEGDFVTPGLNTGVDSDMIPGPDVFGFP